MQERRKDAERKNKKDRVRWIKMKRNKESRGRENKRYRKKEI